MTGDEAAGRGAEEASLLDMAVLPLLSPARGARQVGRRGSHAFAWMLLGAMAVVTAVNTLNLLYYHQPAPLLPVPLGVPLEEWRSVQRLWFAPYALLVAAGTAALLAWDSPRLAGAAVGFRAMVQAMAVAGFGPWLVTMALDAFLIAADLGDGAVLAAVHLAALGWSGMILIVVLREGCGVPQQGARTVAATGFVLVTAFLGMVLR